MTSSFLAEIFLARCSNAFYWTLVQYARRGAFRFQVSGFAPLREAILLFVWFPPRNMSSPVDLAQDKLRPFYRKVETVMLDLGSIGKALRYLILSNIPVPRARLILPT